MKKNILEPVFEPYLLPAPSRTAPIPGKAVGGALEASRMLLRPKTSRRNPTTAPYHGHRRGHQGLLLDQHRHHGLMNRVRRAHWRCEGEPACRASSRPAVLSEEQFLRTDSGTPQGGILSPLLANIALSAIEERYERHVWPRRTPTLQNRGRANSATRQLARAYDRKRGRVLFFPIRYADDFIILVSAPHGPEQSRRAEEAANHEKVALATALRDTLHLELSETKTLVTR